MQSRYFITSAAATPLEASRVPKDGGGNRPLAMFNFSLKEKLLFWGLGWYFFLVLISLGRVVIPYPKIVINLPWINEKIHCKGKPFRFSGYQNPSVQTDRQKKNDRQFKQICTVIILDLYEKILFFSRRM